MEYIAIQLVEWGERDGVKYIVDVRQFRATATHTPKGRLTTFFQGFVSDAVTRMLNEETVSFEIIRVVDTE